MSLYRKLLEKSKEAIATLEIPFKERKEQKNLELRIINLEQKIAEDELIVQSSLQKYPIDYDKWDEATDNLELTRRKLKKLQELQIKLFSEEEDEVQKGKS